MKPKSTIQTFRIFSAFIIFLLPSYNNFAQQMDLKIYNQTNTPVFGTNNFKAIGIGKDGNVWVGTANLGLYKFNGTIWEKSAYLQNNNINDIKTDRDGGIWIAQSGYTGAQAITGGINYFPNADFNNTFYSTLEGLPTRYAISIFINNNVVSTPYPWYRIWSAHLGTITGVAPNTGAVGRGKNSLNTQFRTITAGVVTTDGLGSCQVIGGGSKEVWVFAKVNTGGRNQILRYDISTENYINAYDELSNPSLPSGFTAKAIYFDKNDQGWIGMRSGGIYVLQNGVFQNINFPTIFPAGTAINTNAITGDKYGNIYIGTTNGLVVYNGHVLNDVNSYKLYTTAEGLPSNNVQGIAIDSVTNNAYNRILATDNGIVRWNPEPSDSVKISGVVTYIADGSLEPSPDISIKPFKDVTVSATGLYSTVTTDKDGSYSFNVQKGYSGTITPSYKDFKFFQPEKIDVSNVQSELEHQDIVYNPTLAVPTSITSPVGSPDVPLACLCLKQNHKDLSATPCNMTEPPKIEKYGWSLDQRCGHTIGDLGDQRFAWDMNMKFDIDSGRKVYAVADGVVTKIGAWSGNSSGQLLLKHTTASGAIWYSGYLHMRNITTKNSVKAGEPIGTISNVNLKKKPDGTYKQEKTPNHLHFGILYEDPFIPNKFNSVDRPDGAILPRIVTATEWEIASKGSIVSGALVLVKTDSIWNEYGRTDENGKLTLLFMPAVKLGDSIKIIAAGYEEMTLPVDSASITGSNVIIPMIPTFSPSSNIKYASVISLDQKAFYDDPTVHLKVTGQNISAYDVIQEIDLGDSLSTETIFSNKSNADSLITIKLTETGSNVYSFVFKGVDTVQFYKTFDYEPGTTDFYNVTLTVPDKLHGSELYIDGSFIKNLTKADESISLFNGEHVLNVRAAGYKDTTFSVTTSATYSLSLVAENYQQPDSIIYNFPANGRIQYYNKITGLDSARKTIVSIKQSMDNFSGMGLIPKSRKFEFTHLNTTWSGMRLVTVLDQQERLSIDSIYLLRIYNDTSFTKILFSVNEVNTKYDSAEQKLNYDFIDFNKGSALKEALVIMKKQAPLVKEFSDLTISADTSLSISLNQIFADPDSIKNDLTFRLLDTNPAGLILSLKGDSILITTEKSYTGTTSITIVAEHDSLLAAKTITVTVISGGLPVTLLNFSGTFFQNDVNLNWQTSQEINTSHFSIERSIDDNNFSSIGRVNASGNSSVTKNYSYLDHTPSEGNNFYRLKMIDVDGRFVYSNVIAIRVENHLNNSFVFPNPAANLLNIQLNGYKGNVSLKIFDYLGKKVKEVNIVTNGPFVSSMNIKSLPAGVYFIWVDNKDKKEKIPFIKQ